MSATDFDVMVEVATVDGALAARGTEARALGARAYLKIDLDFHGVDAKGIRATAREVFERHPDLGHDQLVALVRGLWAAANFEMRSVAVALIERRPDLLERGDLELIEQLLRRSHTWALVDYLSTTAAAPIVSRRPDATRELERWSTDDDFWLRRASMLALLPDLRAGAGDWGLFCRFAGSMIDEKEFFIRKAIGWVVREVGRKRPELAYRFLREHIDHVSGVTLREGVKHLADEQRQELLARYRARP